MHRGTVMMHRQQPPTVRLKRVRLASFLAYSFAAATLAGCANPNFIGIQDYGTVYGNVVDSGGKPIGEALLSATGSTSTIRSNGDGSFKLPQISVGTQTISASAPGYGSATTSILVVKDTETSVGNIALVSNTNIPPR